MQLIKRGRLALLLIFILAAGLRFSGLNWGLPLVFNHSETDFVERALQMSPAYTGQADYNPHFFDYPSFYLYLNYGEQRSLYYGGKFLGWWRTELDFLAYYYQNRGVFYLMGRVTTVLLGLLTIAATYSLGAKFLASQVGLWAALFLACSPLHIADSHLVTADVPVLLFIMLTTYFCLDYYQRGKAGSLIAAGVSLGVGIGTKYLPGILLGTLFLSGYWGAPGQRKRALWWGLAATGGAFLVTTPYVLVAGRTFLTHFTKVVAIMYREKQGLHLIQKNPFYYLYPLAVDKLGWGLPIMGLAGAYSLVRKDFRLALLLFFFPLSYLIIISGWGAKYPRYFLPLEPFLYLAAGYCLYKLKPVYQHKRWLASLVVGVMLFFPLRQGLEVTRNFGRADVRLRAQAWLEEHLGVDKVLVIEDHHTIPVLTVLDVLTEMEKATTQEAKEIVWRHYARQKIYLGTWLTWTASQYHLALYPRADYFLVSSEYREMFQQEPRQFAPQLNFYAELEKYATLLQVFKPLAEESGPTLFLYAAREFPSPAAGLSPEQTNNYLTVLAYNLGNASLRLDHLQTAERWYLAALNISPQYVPALTNIGILYSRWARPVSAREYLLQALALDPQVINAQEALAGLGKID